VRCLTIPKTTLWLGHPKRKIARLTLAIAVLMEAISAFLLCSSHRGSPIRWRAGWSRRSREGGGYVSQLSGLRLQNDGSPRHPQHRFHTGQPATTSHIWIAVFPRAFRSLNAWAFCITWPTRLQVGERCSIAWRRVGEKLIALYKRCCAQRHNGAGG
jgi:hypothetical protein